jgi:hypothetical protein
MAQVSISSGSIMRPHRSPWGAFPIKHMIPISTAAQIYAGQIVTLDYTANSTNVGKIKGSSADNYFYGVGVAGAGSTQGTSTTVEPQPIPVYEANPAVEFVANVEGAVTASSIVGRRAALRWDSTNNITVVNLANSSGTDWRVMITGMNGVNGVTGLRGELGDSGAQVTVRFITQLEGNAGSSVALTSTNPVLAFFG